MLTYIIIASILESLVSLVGVIFLFFGFERLKSYIQYFISFSVGTFLGVIFFDILPEALEISEVQTVFLFVIVGFLFFFLLSRILNIYHAHHEDDLICHDHYKKTSGYKVLIGDVIHNFIDGVIIALAFLADFQLGILTTIAVLLHEFPQEASDFFVLINSGFSKGKALLSNFLISFSTILGAILTYFFANNLEGIIGPALGLVAGNFLYIAASDLVPELHEGYREKGTSTIGQFILIILGVWLIYYINSLLSS